MTYTNGNEGLLCVQKTMWRPKEIEASIWNIFVVVY
jgi:hypothetical protein